MAVVPGMMPGQYGFAPQGFMFNTPRNYDRPGAPQAYDPRYATVDPRMTGQPMWSGGGVGGVAKGGGGTVKPGGTGGSTAPNYGRMGGSVSAPGGQGGFNIQTGITAGPVLPQSVVQSEQNRLRSYQPASIGAPFMQHLNDLVGGAMNTAAMDFGRDASFADAQQLLASQQARANAGLGWGGAALGDYASQRGSQLQGLNALMTLLQQFMV